MTNERRIVNHLPLPSVGERIIVGIDGMSRSGKTTLADNLSELLHEQGMQVVVFHIDDYITCRKHRYNTHHEQWYEYYYLQWNAAELREDFLIKLNTSSDLQLSLYVPETDTHIRQTVTIPETALIIIEGVFLQRKEWRDVYDYIIFLDADRESRFRRENKAAKQDMEKFRYRYWKAEEYYLETVRPEEHADLVIKNG